MTETYADAAGRYRLDSQIATGGMGVVWHATDTRLNREVAVKVLKEEFAADDQFRSRFETEARHAAALHHANIAGVFDYDAAPAGRAPYLVMELVPGQPLSALLSQARNDERTLDPGVVRNLLAQASDGLAAAHAAGIVHRDVKPANLIVTPDGRVKVTDFGIARAADGVAITRTGAVMGTPQYLSPEQARGEQATPASDVYALGVVAFECLSGRRPFEGETPVATTLAHLQQPVPDLPAHVPADLAVVVQRAMAKAPGDRYPDAAAFATALRDPAAAAEAATAVLTATPPVVAGLPPATAYDGDAPPPDEGRRRRVWLIVLLVLLAVAALLLLWWLAFGRDDDADPAPAAETTSERTRASRTPQTTEPETTEPETTTPPPATTTAPTTTAPPVVELDPSDYVGRPVADVESELLDMGFQVSLSEVANDGSKTEDEVERIDPHGSVEEGTVITVYYYGPPPAPETSESSPASQRTPEGEDG
jgi:eukaryotic-like serine/threonine-protein kinase